MPGLTVTSKETHLMTDDEVRAEITKQIHDTLGLLIAALRDQATHGAPPSRIILGRAADAVQKVVDGQ
jgi:glucose-6-phosphate-specific signal transduction histidine kinase